MKVGDGKGGEIKKTPADMEGQEKVNNRKTEGENTRQIFC